MHQVKELQSCCKVGKNVLQLSCGGLKHRAEHSSLGHTSRMLVKHRMVEKQTGLHFQWEFLQCCEEQRWVRLRFMGLVYKHSTLHAPSDLHSCTFSLFCNLHFAMKIVCSENNCPSSILQTSVVWERDVRFELS